MPGRPPETFGCAIAQLNSVLFDKEHNLARALEAIEEGARRGARLMAFPELFLTGYFVRDRLAELAEPVDGPSIVRLANAARSYRMVVIVGFAERDGDVFYDAAAVIDATGQILGSYRKVHLYDVEKAYFQHGDSYPIFETAVGSIGVQVCFDVEFPEAPRSLALAGAETIVCVAANMIPFQKHQRVYMQARALENHVWHVFANRVGVEETTLFFGQSGIVDPLGDLAAQADDREGIISAVVDRERIRQSYLTLSYLANRRPETYQKLVAIPKRTRPRGARSALKVEGDHRQATRNEPKEVWTDADH